MLNPICVFDFETDNSDEKVANPVEVACKMIDPFTLTPIIGSEFLSDIKPYGIDEPGYFTKERESTIDFHCKIKKCTRDELLTKWRSAPTEQIVWSLFVKHVNKYNKSNNQWGAPHPAGANIRNFDLPIVARLNERYKVVKLFNYEVLDTRELMFYWLIWDNSLTKRTMDSLRKYFGIGSENAHNAMKDVDDSTTILCRFLKFHKAHFEKANFKGAFKDNE